jgi:hypothetical protein
MIEKAKDVATLRKWHNSYVYLPVGVATSARKVRKVRARTLCYPADRASLSETYGGESTEAVSSRAKLNTGTGRGQTRTGCRGLA